MTDRELLELAAKAAGIECRWVTDRRVTRNKFGMPAHHRLPDTMYVDGREWNPLEDDGDALRLLTKLAFRELYISEIGASVSWRRNGSPHGIKCDEYASEHGGDLNAATRRAIVRAAAALALGEGEEE